MAIETHDGRTTAGILSPEAADKREQLIELLRDIRCQERERPYVGPATGSAREELQRRLNELAERRRQYREAQERQARDVEPAEVEPRLAPPAPPPPPHRREPMPAPERGYIFGHDDDVDRRAGWSDRGWTRLP
jgi:hypothetical protein